MVEFEKRGEDSAAISFRSRDIIMDISLFVDRCDSARWWQRIGL
jgi:hypothetical protein